jgi:hypothetical protein
MQVFEIHQGQAGEHAGINAIAFRMALVVAA